MPSTIDQRRLRDGVHALEASREMPETAAEVRAQLDTVGNGIAALQSLDDLGTEANDRAHRDQHLLWNRYRALETRLKELETAANNHAR